MEFSITYPFVSVIMPVRNEALYITQSVSAVLQQDYPSERMEIIIADGQSNDDTVALIQQLPERERIHIINNICKRQSAGLNRAIHIAIGEIIVRVDGHTVIAPDYVRRCVETLSITRADNVGGAIGPVGRTPMGCAIALASHSRFAVPTTFRVSRKPQYTDTVYMGAWPRRVFEQVGLFNERFAVNEDYEFNFRIRRGGGFVYFSPDICSDYYGQTTLSGLARQYFRYGASKPKMIQKHPQSMRIRHLAAPGFIAFIFGGILLSLFVPLVAIYWVGGLALYLFANAAFSLHSARGKDVSLCLLLPWIFVTIHSAWGSGFWFAIAQTLLKACRRKFVSLS